MRMSLCSPSGEEEKMRLNHEVRDHVVNRVPMTMIALLVRRSGCKIFLGIAAAAGVAEDTGK